MAADSDTDTSLTLLERIQVNPDDPQAWRIFVDRYQPRIHRWCVAWGLQDSDADDVAQEVIVKLFAALRNFRYDPEKSFRGWLRTVTRHAWSDFRAAQRRYPGHDAGSVALIADSAEAQSDLERQLDEVFDRELLEVATRRIKGRVKPSTWEAFRLTAIDGLSGARAAQELGMAVAHVFVAKHRVQKMLQEEVLILKGSDD